MDMRHAFWVCQPSKRLGTPAFLRRSACKYHRVQIFSRTEALVRAPKRATVVHSCYKRHQQAVNAMTCTQFSPPNAMLTQVCLAPNNPGLTLRTPIPRDMCPTGASTWFIGPIGQCSGNVQAEFGQRSGDARA
eukprot:8771196-Lingulodinium_polyedra.AAC.1